MNIQKLYNDYGIQTATEGDRHHRDGWVNVQCPFCSGNPGFHLGWDEQETHFYCWRCGFHKTADTVSKLLKISTQEAKQLIRQYRIGSHRTAKETKVKIQRKTFQLPSNSLALTRRHLNYLTARGFNAAQLEEEWLLNGTGPVSHLDDIDFKHRIIIPIYWNNKVVTFQSRDITDKHVLKYITCPRDRELVHHKDILYGNQNAWKDVGICVEGVTDVWRLGSQAFSTFGIEYTKRQVRVIAEYFKKVIVVFDPEPQAQKQAAKLVGELKFRGVQAERMEVNVDPGSMLQSEAEELVKQINCKVI